MKHGIAHSLESNFVTGAKCLGGLRNSSFNGRIGSKAAGLPRAAVFPKMWIT